MNNLHTKLYQKPIVAKITYSLLRTIERMTYGHNYKVAALLEMKSPNLSRYILLSSSAYVCDNT